MKKLVLVGLVLALSGGSVGASVAKVWEAHQAAATDPQKQFQAGYAAYLREDYKTALRLLTPCLRLHDAPYLGRSSRRAEWLPVEAGWQRKAADPYASRRAMAG